MWDAPSVPFIVSCPKGTSWSRQYVRESVFQIRDMFACGIRNPRFWNPDHCSRNPTNDWNPESKFHWQRLESSTCNLESMARNPDSKTVLDSLTRGERILTGYNNNEKSTKITLWKSCQVVKIQKVSSFFPEYDWLNFSIFILRLHSF